MFLCVSGDDVEETMQFAAVKIGGTSGEPFHKNQKLKWDHKVNAVLLTIF